MTLKYFRNEIIVTLPNEPHPLCQQCFKCDSYLLAPCKSLCFDQISGEVEKNISKTVSAIHVIKIFGMTYGKHSMRYNFWLRSITFYTLHLYDDEAKRHHYSDSLMNFLAQITTQTLLVRCFGAERLSNKHKFFFWQLKLSKFIIR